MCELKVEAEMDQLYTILDNLEEWLDDNGCSMKVKMQLNIAIEEVFANIVNYAYPQEKGEIIVKYKIDKVGIDDYVSIQFMDSGKPYNPLENEDPNIHLSVDDREIGGLGIFMVRRIMDKVQYSYQENFNILTIQKKI